MAAQEMLKIYRCCFCGKKDASRVHNTTTKVDIKELVEKYFQVVFQDVIAE